MIDLVRRWARGANLDSISVYNVATESTAGAGRLLVAVLAVRTALVDVELESEEDSAGLALETFPVVSFIPGRQPTRTHRLQAGEAGT